MKKLMIALAAVAMAAGVQAANVKWSVAGDANVNGLMVYVCDPTLVPVQIAAASDINGYLLGSPVNTGTFSGSRNIAASGILTGLSDDLAGQMQAMTFIVVSADGTGYWTASGSGEIYTTSTSPVEATATMKGLTADNMTRFSGGPTPVIPEPTSGLLLLLGVAGLALRRKQK